MKRKSPFQKSHVDSLGEPLSPKSLGAAENKLPTHKPRITIEYVRTDSIEFGTYLRDADPEAIARIAANIDRFGFIAPVVLGGKGNRLWIGHKRVLAAIQIGLEEVLAIRAEHLSEAELRVCAIADNRLAELSSWNERALGEELRALHALNLDFSLELTGYQQPEIDYHIQLVSDPLDDGEDLVADALAARAAVSRVGDVWELGRHRVLCGDSLDPKNHDLLLAGAQASAVFSDPPYNVRVASISGLGRTKHREFAMASGEMSKAEFTEFLAKVLTALRPFLKPGAIVFLCMDWRHVAEVSLAVEETGFTAINICVWVKHNASLGSLYRSQHEFVFVIRSESEKHMNCVQLGRFGRHRTNVWQYKGANDFARGDGEGDLLALHATPKPVALVGDAIMDCTRRGDIVLDPFLGSGTSVIAAERTGRACYAIEIDPLYVDTAVMRWQRLTGQKAHHKESGRTFDEIEAEQLARGLPRKRPVGHGGQK